jgi:hypothetical protein
MVYTDSKDEEILDSVDDKNKGEQSLADEITKTVAVRLIAECNKFKQSRLDKIQKYRDLYAGSVPKKFRQPFNVVLPVFAGIMDTLAADFNDDLSVDITEKEPADYISVRKIARLWHDETTSLSPNARFAYKARTDRHNALFSGRGFMMNYAVSSPEYRNCFEIFELEDAIFQADGGGLWDLHRYSGRQNVIRSAHDLKSGSYDKEQVKKLLACASKSDFMPYDSEEEKAGLTKFKAMGLDPKSADFVGEQLFKLVEMRLNVRGTRYYLLFSPWYQTWLRFDKFKEVFSADIDPWVSWQTHEDNKNFLNKSYGDDAYGVADATHTLFNQELTNREKKNLNARMYDREMVPDVAKLDAAQYRPDALVPIDTKGGVRKLSDAVFTFETPQLQGTINLIDWTQQQSGKALGVSDVSMGQADNVSKKATVVLAEQHSISKRLLLRSSPYTEAMGLIARNFIQSAKDHLPAKKALSRLGIDGEDWDRVIKRTDLDLWGDVDVKVTSSAIEMRNSQLKKEARSKVLTEISMDPNQAAQVNPKWLVKTKLKDIAELDEGEIKLAMDTQNYGNETEVARAHEAIQAVQANQKPQVFYGATTLFMQIIHDFAVNNRNSLGDRKYQILIDFEMAHGSIAQENMIRRAQQTPVAPTDPNAAPPAEGLMPTATPTPTTPPIADRTVAAERVAAL